MRDNLNQQNLDDIDINSLEDIDCENCDSTGFVSIYTLKKIPAIMSPDGQEHILPVFLRFECIDCGFAIIP